MVMNIFLMLRGWSSTKLHNLRKYQHAWVWGYALLVTLPPLVRKNYGPMVMADYCYFPESRDWRRLLFYAPVFICVCCVLIVFIYAVFFIVRKQFKVTTVLIVRRLAFMVVIFVVSWGLALEARVQDAVAGRDVNNLQMIGITLSGFCNFLVWGVTHQKVLDWFVVHICCRSCCRVVGLQSETSVLEEIDGSINSSLLDFYVTTSAENASADRLIYAHSNLSPELSDLNMEMVTEVSDLNKTGDDNLHLVEQDN